MQKTPILIVFLLMAEATRTLGDEIPKNWRFIRRGPLRSCDRQYTINENVDVSFVKTEGPIDWLGPPEKQSLSLDCKGPLATSCQLTTDIGVTKTFTANMEISIPIFQAITINGGMSTSTSSSRTEGYVFTLQGGARAHIVFKPKYHWVKGWLWTRKRVCKRTRAAYEYKKDWVDMRIPVQTNGKLDGVISIVAEPVSRPYSECTQGWSLYDRYDIIGNDMAEAVVSRRTDCQDRCRQLQGCRGYSWAHNENDSKCYFKSGGSQVIARDRVFSAMMC